MWAIEDINFSPIGLADIEIFTAEHHSPNMGMNAQSMFSYKYLNNRWAYWAEFYISYGPHIVQ
jgi:hypothetical protein